jgi:hypothetical protein
LYRMLGSGARVHGVGQELATRESLTLPSRKRLPSNQAVVKNRLTVALHCPCAS